MGTQWQIVLVSLIITLAIYKTAVYLKCNYYYPIGGFVFPVNITRRNKPNTITGTIIPLAFEKPKQNSVIDVYDVSASPDLIANCTVMPSVKPTTHICCYNKSDDMCISKQLLSGQPWEINSLLMIQKEMRKDPEMGFIDIGANIGVFSLVVATMGHKVVAVEPLTKTIRLLAKSIRMGKLVDNVVLLKTGISDKRQMGALMINPTNRGASLLVRPERCSQTNTCEHIKLIYMDDLLPFITFNKAILKMDIEQKEHCALQYASRLFNKIHIPYIIMEWKHIRGLYMAHFPKSQDHLKVERAIHFLFQRGYMVTVLNATNHAIPISPTLHWAFWPNDIVWKYEGTSTKL